MNLFLLARSMRRLWRAGLSLQVVGIWRLAPSRFLMVLIVLATTFSPAAAFKFKIQDIIPNTSSNETVDQSEPNIAPNLRPAALHDQFIIGTFGDPAGGASHPYFRTTNAAESWTISNLYAHGDSTAEFSPTGTAYAGFLRNNGSQIDVESSPGPNGGGAFANNLGNQSTLGPKVPPAVQPDPDQPWIDVARVGGKDNIYVGLNDVGASNGTNGNSGKTATIHYAGNDGANPWRQVVLDHVGTPRIGGPGTDFLGDAPSIRVASAGDRVYAAFQRYTGAVGNDRNGEVVVVRDDAPGVGGVRTFTSIPNAGGNANNESKVSGAAAVRLPGAGAGATLLGNYQKIRSSISLAVHPSNSDIVYMAYTEVVNSGGTNIPQLRVKRSADKGESWSSIAAPVQNGINSLGATALPALTVSRDGTLGMLFYIDDSAKKRTEVQLMRYNHSLGSAGFTPLASFSTDAGSVLQNSLANQFTVGDFIDLESIHNRFYGTFIASNKADAFIAPNGTVMGDALFNHGVSFLRNTNGMIGQAGFALRNNADTANVGFSLDPFFLAVVPEPSSTILIVAAATFSLLNYRRRK